MQRNSFVVILAGLLLIGGCASKPVVPEIKEDTKALPTDLQTKFEVVESDGPATTPSPTPTPTPVASKKKGKATKEAKAPKTAKVAAPFSIPNRRVKPDPIWIGEKVTMEVTYIGLAAGEISMEVMPPKKMNDRMVYHFKGIVKSSAVMNLF